MTTRVAKIAFILLLLLGLFYTASAQVYAQVLCATFHSPDPRELPVFIQYEAGVYTLRFGLEDRKGWIFGDAKTVGNRVTYESTYNDNHFYMEVENGKVISMLAYVQPNMVSYNANIEMSRRPRQWE